MSLSLCIYHSIFCVIESHLIIISFRLSPTIFHTHTTAHMFVEFAEYRLALSQSSIWSRPELMEDVRRAVKVTFITNITLGVILYFAISTIVSLLTENMDRRMVDIVMGSSRLFAGFVFFVLSVNMPQWYGVYFMEKRHVATFRSLREVKFNFAWSLWKQISAMFFFNMFFSCRTLQLANVYGVIGTCVVFHIRCALFVAVDVAADHSIILDTLFWSFRRAAMHVLQSEILF